jgi:CheY-like chemotaxis protein
LIPTVRILVVEDNPGDADLIADAFADAQRPVELQVLVDGAQAVDFLLRRPPYAHARRPHLVLLDLNLPKIGGRDVLRELKRHEDLAHIPVVVLTTSDSPNDIASLYASGASAYVCKAVDLTQFQRVMRGIESFWLSVAKLPSA